MRSVQVVTNSVGHIPQALCSELNIHVVPLPFVWDGETFHDDVDMGPRQFYSRLRASNTLPQTSGPEPKAFIEVFDAIANEDGRVLAIVVASVFSSTFDAALLAKGEMPDADITLIDSESNSMGLGFLALAAARAAKEGKPMDEIIQLVERAKDTTGVVFAVNDIHYLRRGGRISAIEHYFSSALQLFPILEIRRGPIKPIGRIRTEKRVIPRLLEIVGERVGDSRPLRLAVLHADAEEQAWQVRNEAQKRFAPDELLVSELTPVVGVHTGPDALGIAYSLGV